MSFRINNTNKFENIKENIFTLQPLDKVKFAHVITPIDKYVSSLGLEVVYNLELNEWVYKKIKDKIFKTFIIINEH